MLATNIPIYPYMLACHCDDTTIESLSLPIPGPGVDQPVEGRSDQCVPTVRPDHGQHEQESAQQIRRRLWNGLDHPAVRTEQQHRQLRYGGGLVWLVTVGVDYDNNRGGSDAV